MSKEANNHLNLDFEQIADGALRDKVQKELAKIAENILDQNTSHKKKRVLTIQIGFTPNEKRDLLTTSINVKATLAPATESLTTMLIGQDFNTGKIAMNELHSGTKGQMYFDPKDEKLKTDTGQDVEEVEMEIAQENIINYNAKKKAK